MSGGADSRSMTVRLSVPTVTDFVCSFAEMSDHPPCRFHSIPGSQRDPPEPVDAKGISAVGYAVGDVEVADRNRPSPSRPCAGAACMTPTPSSTWPWPRSPPTPTEGARRSASEAVGRVDHLVDRDLGWPLDPGVGHEVGDLRLAPEEGFEVGSKSRRAFPSRPAPSSTCELGLRAPDGPVCQPWSRRIATRGVEGGVEAASLA